MQELETKRYYSKKNGWIGVIGGITNSILCIGASFWLLNKMRVLFSFPATISAVTRWVFLIFAAAVILMLCCYLPYRWLTLKSRFKKYSHPKQIGVFALICVIPVIVILLILSFIAYTFLDNSLSDRLQELFCNTILLLTVFTNLSMFMVVVWYPFISRIPAVTLNKKMVTFKWRPIFLRTEIPFHMIESATLINKDKQLLIVYEKSKENKAQECKFPLKVLLKADRAEFVQNFFQYKEARFKEL